MKKVFAEIGLGNDTFFSTEFEKEGTEYRIPKFILPTAIHEVYFRFWLFKKVFILSTVDGFKTTSKSKNNFKILFGIGGETN
ncbi:MAG: DUF3977 family protein [bacterium]|nr:DUF3977 family protein [bacterium]